MKIFPLTRVNSIEGMNSSDSPWLITRCLEGDEQAIEMLVRRFESDVFRLALSILQDTHEAREATQDTFIAALKALPTYQERSSFKSWLYTITVNASRNRLRKRKVLAKLKNTLGAIFQVESQKQPLPEDAILQTEKETVVWNALNTLDEKHRIVMILRYFQDLPTKEISAILSVSEGTVHSRLHNARERLRVALEGLNRNEQ